jgi:hypothetical protein
MRIDSDGNVGIGDTNPARKLTVQGGSGDNLPVRVVGGSGTTKSHMEFQDASTTADYKVTLGSVGDGMSFQAGGSERLRIDSSGNLLVGKSTAAFGTAGVELKPSGETYVTRASATPLYVRRNTNDGNIVEFWKDNATVGSIGTYSTDLTIGTTDVGVRFDDNASSYIPWNVSTNAATDATIDLGASSVRYKDLYRSGSTYSTSDRNKKQDIRDLTDAEARVAVVAKGSLKAFRYIDTVEAEGDDANIHFGIIAQDLKAAFEAEGLNADSYQVLKTSTYTDDNGVEQTTYSVCYENLLAFIISAI